MEEVHIEDGVEYDDTEVLETCIVDGTEYEGLIDDDDSNIGSMVSIQSEEAVECEEEVELIIPDRLDPTVDRDSEEKQKSKTQVPITSSKVPTEQDSWPTLEILPGGVINLAEKNYLASLCSNVADEDTVPASMMYACAKCSRSFKYLFCLVKHVKWHEDEEKKEKGPSLAKLSELERELVIVKRARQELEKAHKKQKLDVYERIAKALGSMDSINNVVG